MPEGSFYHFIHENLSAAAWMITWVKMLQMSKYLRRVKGGMQQITDPMLARATARGVEVNRNHLLRGLTPAGQNNITLVFEKQQPATARHVILALPAQSLKECHGLPEPVRKQLATVIKVPLLKAFFVVKRPWWTGPIPNEGVSDFPTRELHYYRHQGKGNIMVYADRPCFNYWGKYANPVCHQEAEIEGNHSLRLTFARRMHLPADEIIS